MATRPAPFDVPDIVSEDGRLRVRRGSSSTVGNAWICQPRVLDERAGATLLDMWVASTSDWGVFDVTFDGPTVSLELRRFPGRTGATFVIDADARTYAVRDALRAGKGLDAVHERLRAAGLVEA